MQRELKPPLKIDMIKVWGIIKSNFKQLLLGTVFITCVAIIYCVFAPPIYTANTIINPPKLGDSGTGLASAFGGLATLAGVNTRAFVLVNDSDTTIAFLKSRYVVDQVIKKLGLVRYYKARDITIARKALMGATTIIPDAKSGLLEIDVDDKNPKIAADIANSYVIALGGLISSIGLNAALHKREFYEGQIIQVKKDLAQAQKILQDFMIKNGITAGAQTTIVTGISTQLQAQLAVAQSQLISMERYATADNPDYKTLQSQIKSLKDQILNLSGTTSTINDNISIPANLAPKLSQEYINLITQVAFISEIYSLLTKQYEASKLDELIDQKPISVQVIDYAEPPLYKSKPKRLKIIMSAFFLGFLLSFIYVIFKNRRLLLVK